MIPDIVSDEPLCPQIMSPVLKPDEGIELGDQTSSIDLISLEMYNRIFIMCFLIIHAYLASVKQIRGCSKLELFISAMTWVSSY